MENGDLLLIQKSNVSLPGLKAATEELFSTTHTITSSDMEEIAAAVEEFSPRLILLELHSHILDVLSNPGLPETIPTILVFGTTGQELLNHIDPERFAGILDWPSPGAVLRNTVQVARQLFDYKFSPSCSSDAGGCSPTPLPENQAANEHYPLCTGIEKNRQRYRFFFDNSHDAIFIHDLQGNILDVNRRAKELFGYSTEEFLQKKVMELHPENIQQDSRQAFEEILQKGELCIEIDFLRKDGSVFTAEVSASLYNEGDCPVVQGIVRDISRQKQMEKELTLSESLYRSLVESSPVAIGIHYDTILTYLNPKALQLIGAASFDEVAGKSIFDLIHPDSLDDAIELYREFVEVGEIIKPAELKLLGQDGAVRFIRATSIPIDNLDKTSAQIVAWDITEQVVLKEALQASEREYRGLFEKASDAILILNPDNEQVLEVNPQACKLYGYRRDEFVGLSLKALSGDLHSREPYLESTLKSNGAVNFETRHIRKDGSVMELEVNASVVQYHGKTAILSINRDITEQKNSRRKIIEAEERFRIAAQCASDLIYEWDIQTNRLEWYGNIEKVLGYRDGAFPRELSAWAKRLHPDDAEQLTKLVSRLRRSADPINVEYRVRHEDGSWLYWMNRGMAIPDENGQPRKYIGVITDVTRQRLAEAALRESQERLSIVVESTGLGIWDYNFRTGKVIRNRQWAEMLGYSLEEVETSLDFWKEHIHPDDLAVVEEAEQRHLQGETDIFRMEHRLRTKSGEWKWVLNWGKIIETDEDGKPLRAVGTHLDISDLKKTEEALRASEERYRQFFELDLTGDYISKAEGEFLACNPAFLNLFGFEDLAEAQQFSLTSIFPSESDWRQFLERLCQQKQIMTHECTLRRKDGQILNVVESAVGSFDENGRLTLIHGFILDVTKQNQLEKQVRQAQKMEAIGTLAGGIAHDFNNILAAILGYSELTLDDLPAHSIAYKNIKAIHSAGVRAKELVNQILTFSRGAEQELKPVQIGLLVNEALKLLEASLPATIKLIKRIERSRATVLSDPSQIHQVVMNLCTNAYQAMGETGGVLRVSLREVRVDAETAAEQANIQPGRFLKLSVDDTGQGMDEKTLQRIFDPFFTTKAVGKGTGLGLSVVHGIVKNIGGFIEVASTPGRGTQFDIYFPVHQANVDQNRPSAHHTRGGNERILLVEDDPNLLDVGKQMLETLGYSVVATTSSLEALQSFHRSPQEFDVIITDQLMPIMTGSELAVECLSIRPNIPIILMTAYSEEMTPEKANRLGIRQFIYKPVDRDELARSVRNALIK